MTSKPFVVHLIGPSTSGKSSIFEALGKKLPMEIYSISFDKMKWQLVNYHRDKHRHLIKDLVVGFFELVCDKRVPIFLDCHIKNSTEYNHFKQIAGKNGYVFLSIELTAPLEVLLTRFRERVESSRLTGSKLSVATEDVFLAETSRRPYVPEDTLIFDTSEESIETVAEAIIGLLNKT